MLNKIKPVFQWRGDHLFCGELCLASFSENGKGGFEVAHAEFQRAIATEISEDKMNRFFRTWKTSRECQKYLQDVYSEILDSLELSIRDGSLFFEYSWPAMRLFASGEENSAHLGCGGIYLGKLSRIDVLKDILYVFSPDPFPWRMARSGNLLPTDIISFQTGSPESALLETERIVDPVLKSLEFSF